MGAGGVEMTMKNSDVVDGAGHDDRHDRDPHAVYELATSRLPYVTCCVRRSS